MVFILGCKYFYFCCKFGFTVHVPQVDIRGSVVFVTSFFITSGCYWWCYLQYYLMVK